LSENKGGHPKGNQILENAGGGQRDRKGGQRKEASPRH